MLVNRLSMRVSLVIAIVVMGYLAMVLAYISAEIYRSKTLDYQRITLEDMLGQKLNDVLRKLEWQSRELVMSQIQKQPLSGGLHSNGSAALARMIDGQFDHYLVSSGEINVRKIFGYSGIQGTILQSRRGVKTGVLDPEMCADIRQRVRQLVRRNQPQTVSGLCIWDSKLYFVTVVPVGSFDAAGYMQVVADPIENLTKTQSDIDMPMSIELVDGSTIYRSGSWPDKLDDKKNLQIDYWLKDSGGLNALKVSVIKDITGFAKEFSKTSYMVMLVAAGITILTIFIALLVLQKTAIQPLQALTSQLRRIRNDRDQLGNQVVTAGNAEVYELGEGFNQMTSELKTLYESLEHMAFTDSLTNLPNRAQFHDRLELAINNASQDGKNFSLFIINLDRFKEINYTLGHHVGDSLLQKVGSRLMQRLNSGDAVARLGSDEFAMLLVDCNAKAAALAARSLLDALARPFEVGEQNFYLGASIGISIFPDHGENKNQLIQRADVAMYAAKNGKSGYMLYYPDLDRDNPGRLAMMSDLRYAIDNKEFVLYYQPKVDLVSGHIHGAEALVRWQRVAGKEASPDVFIPILEQTGQIRALTQWVLQEAMQQIQRWMKMGLDIKIAVNLSTRDLQDGGLPTHISKMLAEYGVLARQLELEITESAMMLDPARSLDTLQHLAAMGIHVTIDDFGTGYSSLTYLKQLPARAIKIDKSFVLGMEQDQNDAAIVYASIELAHNLGLRVIAEGVENLESIKLLRDHDCDYAQGYYISQPMPADVFFEWLKQSTWGVAQES